MNRRWLKAMPWSLIFFGLLFLFVINMPILSGICFVIGITMLFERVWQKNGKKTISFCREAR